MIIFVALSLVRFSWVAAAAATAAVATEEDDEAASQLLTEATKWQVFGALLVDTCAIPGRLSGA